jgi:hypothetical protein
MILNVVNLDVAGIVGNLSNLTNSSSFISNNSNQNNSSSLVPNITNGTSSSSKKRLQLTLTLSGFDQLIYFYNKNNSDMIPLTNLTNRVIIDPYDEIGLLGFFDVSGTIATTINY